MTDELLLKRKMCYILKLIERTNDKADLYELELELDLLGKELNKARNVKTKSIH